MKILIIQPFRYGDIMQTQPVIKSIREKFSGCAVHFVADDYFVEILENNGYIDRLIPFPKMKALADMKYRKAFKQARETIYAFAQELKRENYDYVINFNYTKSAALIAHMARALSKTGKLCDASGFETISGEWSKYMLFFTAARRYNPFNIVDMFYLVAEEALKLKKGSLVRHPVFFEAGACDAVKSEEFIKSKGINSSRMVGIQVGASKSHRMLLNIKYPELAARISDAGFDVILFGGGNETKPADLVAKTAGASSRVFNSCGVFNIRENYVMLSKLRLFITADTLNMHLAAAAKTPLLSIFYGEAYPFETGPYTAGAYVAMPSVPCAPCSRADSCGDRVCLAKVKMEDIYACAVKILNAEEIKMKSGSGVNLYRTGIDSSSGYELELCAGTESPEELLDRIFKELYAECWGGIFSNTMEAFYTGVEKIWADHRGEIETYRNKASVIKLLKGRASEYMKINSAAREGMDCVDRMRGASTRAKKTAVAEKFRGVEDFFMKEMKKGGIMGSYFMVEAATAESDPARAKMIFSNIMLASSGFTFALTYFIQKIHENSLFNDEEMIIV
jgi:ADP-heptose:LPS heptosyltransferase